MAIPRYITAHEVSSKLAIGYDAAIRLMRAAGAIQVGRLVRIEEDRLVLHLESCRGQDGTPTTTSDPAGEVGMPSSTPSTSTSASTRKTRRKPSENSPNSFGATEFDQLLPRRQKKRSPKSV